MSYKYKRTLQKSLPVLDDKRKRPSQSVFNPFAVTAVRSRWLVQRTSKWYMNYDKVPTYPCQQRDEMLREIVRTNPYAALAIYNATAKLSGIDLKITARDENIYQHTLDARTYNSLFYYAWRDVADRFIRDWLTQDNGAFLEILDDAENSRIKTTEPRVTFGGLRYLDSQTVRRTGEITYPVEIYHDDGKWYRMHYTRIFSMVQMKEGETAYRGMGQCGISRALMILRTMQNLHRMYDEVMGSRPRAQVISGNVPTETLEQAFQLIDGDLEDDTLNGSSRLFGGTVLIGSSMLDSHPNITVTPLRNFPEGFDLKEPIDQMMIALAHILGFDIRELWQAKERGATRGDSVVSDQKMRTKTTRLFKLTIVSLVEQMILPSHLRVTIISNDIEEQLEIAETQKIIAETTALLMRNGLIDVRSGRAQLLEAGYITETDFTRMELENGRLPDGASVYMSFYKQDAQPYLELFNGVDLLDTEQHTNPLFWNAVRVTARRLLAIQARADVEDANMVIQLLAALSYLNVEYGDGKPYGTPRADNIDVTVTNGSGLPLTTYNGMKIADGAKDGSSLSIA